MTQSGFKTTKKYVANAKKTETKKARSSIKTSIDNELNKTFYGDYKHENSECRRNYYKFNRPQSSCGAKMNKTNKVDREFY